MKLHRLNGYIQNIFLAEYEHGCMLLDGACKVDFTTVADFFENTLKRPLSDLKVVVVTHMHPDHAGAAHLFRHKTGCRIVTGTFDKQWYRGLSGRIGHIVDVLLSMWVASRLGKPRANLWYPAHLKADYQLADGQAIPGFEDWRVLATPGHTDRDISLINYSAKQAYIADVVVRVKGKLTSPYPVHKPVEYKRSLSLLRNLKGYEFMMAHVPNQLIDNNAWDTLIRNAPVHPQNNWNAIKYKVLKFPQPVPKS